LCLAFYHFLYLHYSPHYLNCRFKQKWTTAYCLTDHDGDGQTNGEELGDPCCTWNFGDTPQVTEAIYISHPGVASSTTTASSCAGSIAAPTGVVGPDVGATRARITWDLPAVTSSCVCYYELTIRNGGSIISSASSTYLRSSTNDVVLCDLPPSTTLTVTLAAKNRDTTSAGTTISISTPASGNSVSLQAATCTTMLTTPLPSAGTTIWEPEFPWATGALVALLLASIAWYATLESLRDPTSRLRNACLHETIGQTLFRMARVLCCRCCYPCCFKRIYNVRKPKDADSSIAHLDGSDDEKSHSRSDAAATNSQRYAAIMQPIHSSKPGPCGRLVKWLFEDILALSWSQFLSIMVVIVLSVAFFVYWYDYLKGEIYVWGGAGIVYRAIGYAAYVPFTLVLLPVTKHSIWTSFCGFSLDRIIQFHRWAGAVAVLLSIVHGVGLYFAYAGSFWGGSFIFTLKGANYAALPGTAAGILFLLIVATSLEFVRRSSYKFFHVVHMLSIVAIFLTVLHAPLFIVYMMPGAILYLLDYVLLAYHWVKHPTKLVRWEPLKPMPAGDEDPDPKTMYIKLTIVRENFEFKAGQFVFILAPSISWLPHPLSIASAPQLNAAGEPITSKSNEPHHIIIIVKAMTDTGFARKLIESRPDKIVMFGPCGSPKTHFHEYEHVMLVAGGVGITPFSSKFIDLHRSNCNKTLRLVWASRDRELVEHTFGIMAAQLNPGTAWAKSSSDEKASSPDDNSSVGVVSAGQIQDNEAHAEAGQAHTKPAATSVLEMMPPIPLEELGPLQMRLKNRKDATSSSTIRMFFTGKGLDAPVAHSDVESDAILPTSIITSRPQIVEEMWAFRNEIESALSKDSDSQSVIRIAVGVCGPDIIVSLVKEAAQLLSTGRVEFDIHDESFLW
jgi:predicted ferric reductase